MVTPRAMINQVLQLGVEETHFDDNGSTVVDGGSATNRLGTFNSQIAPVAAGAFGMFRPSGGKYVGEVVPTDIYSEGAFTDTVDFNTITFPYAGNVGYADEAKSRQGTDLGGGAFLYDFQNVEFAPLNTHSYVVQEGMIGAVYNHNNVVVPDFNMRFMRTGASQAGGRILGKKQPEGTSLVAATRRKGRALSGIKTGVWMGHPEDEGGWNDMVEGTNIERLRPVALDIAIRHNAVFAPWFALDDSIISFAGTLEQAIDAGVQISILADVDAETSDVVGIFNFAAMEDGEPIYIKVLSLGALIDGDIFYTHDVNMSLQISGPPRRTNVASLRVWQWDAIMMPVFDTETEIETSLRARVKNTLDPAAFAVS